MKIIIDNLLRKICKVWSVIVCIIVGILNLFLFAAGVPVFDITNNRTSILLIIYIFIIILLNNKRKIAIKYLIQLTFSLLLALYGILYLRQIINDPSVKFNADTAHMYLYIIGGSIIPSILLLLSTACSFFLNKKK
ncbi:hypothetical protein [Inconstantimicrobium mannanitabidum]|uniref:Uncharacterized protein n=1 Tax=Inconstantimicrobium mannanitabidum TaxID=1604901 RepID=A0ACB5R706_9CLOT|nr:hypothetical protein [Clostridium sp. TW13]GKX64781.1 hypothetical protein rsdtw13_00390 [Clostridium sp. TW13]